MRALAQARGKTREEADELVRQFSGHSMRASYATEAGSKDLPSYRIMQQRFSCRAGQAKTLAISRSQQTECNRAHCGQEFADRTALTRHWGESAQRQGGSR